MELSAETIDFIEQNAEADVRTLALKAKRTDGVDLPLALTQIAGRQTARQKLPTWGMTDGILYAPHLPLEQCSSEITARYKATLVGGESFADLTAGFGVDCFFLSSNKRRAVYVERQAQLCDLARHNFPLLRKDPVIEVVNADCTEYLQRMAKVDCLFIDPARRDVHGRKTVAIADCEPDICRLEPLLLEKGKTVLVKLSPMLDITQALRSLSSVKDVYVISVQNECKELLLRLSSDEVGEAPHIHCVNLWPRQTEENSLFTLPNGMGIYGSSFGFTPNEETTATVTYADTVGQYLYEPNASLLKAGAYHSVGVRCGLQKLHPNSHLYTGENFLPDFPGRCFTVEQTWGFSKKELKDLAALKQANVTVRNFPSSVNDLRKKLHLTDGGDTYLFATTLATGEKVLIQCRKAKR